MRSMSACLVLPLGLGLARRAMPRKGSLAGSADGRTLKFPPDALYVVLQ